MIEKNYVTNINDLYLSQIGHLLPNTANVKAIMKKKGERKI